MSGRDEISGNQLRSIVERLERIEDEIKELTEAKKEIFLEAKSNGFEIRIVREVIRVRKEDQKEREERQSLLEVYLQAMKGTPRLAKRLAHGGAVGETRSRLHPCSPADARRPP
jgi:uncharacterized protein (UPF0335 family)